MSSNTIGILIIIGIIIIAIMTGGDIFGLPPIAPADTSSSRSNSVDLNDPEILYPAVSAYADLVYLDRVNEPGTFNEYFEIVNSLDDGERVLLTGWKIKSTVTGQIITIGGATTLPNIGIAVQSPIEITQGDRVIVSPGESPIGTSFRINKCTGFLEERMTFTPTLPVRCPAIDYAPALSNSINNRCLDYIESLPRCEVPKERDFPNSEEDGYSLSNACENFITTQINYQSCVTHHLADRDFLQPEVRVFAGRRGIMTVKERDNFLLIDNAGQVVDVYNVDDN